MRQRIDDRRQQLRPQPVARAVRRHPLERVVLFALVVHAAQPLLPPPPLGRLVAHLRGAGCTEDALEAARLASAPDAIGAVVVDAPALVRLELARADNGELRVALLPARHQRVGQRLDRAEHVVVLLCPDRLGHSDGQLGFRSLALCKRRGPPLARPVAALLHGSPLRLLPALAGGCARSGLLSRSRARVDVALAWLAADPLARRAVPGAPRDVKTRDVGGEVGALEADALRRLLFLDARTLALAELPPTDLDACRRG